MEAGGGGGLTVEGDGNEMLKESMKQAGERPVPIRLKYWVVSGAPSEVWGGALAENNFSTGLYYGCQ